MAEGTTVLPWMEVGFSPACGVFDVLLTNSFVLSTSMSFSRNKVIVIVKSKYSSVIVVFEICGEGWRAGTVIRGCKGRD